MKRKRRYVAVLCRDFRQLSIFERDVYKGTEILIGVDSWLTAERLLGLELSGFLILPGWREEQRITCEGFISLLDFVTQRIRG